MTSLRALLGAVAFPVALAACVAGATAETVRVTINDLAFAPSAITVHVGDTIEWTNRDFVAHTATAMNGDWDVEIEPGSTAQVTVRKAGLVQYYCQFHPDMMAHVTVLAN